MELIVILFAALLLYGLQCKVYEKYWSKGLSLSLRYQRETLFEGEKNALLEVLTNDKRLPLPWVIVKFQVSRNLSFSDGSNTKVTDHTYRQDMFSIAMRQRITRTLPFTCTKRGYYLIRGADLVSADLLGVCKLAQSVSSATQLTVYPALVDQATLSIPFRHISGSMVTQSVLHPDPFAFRSIRDYQPTDSLRHINFQASARLGTLMTNEYFQTLSQELLFVLNVEKFRSWLHDDLAEWAIRITASMIGMALQAGLPVGLRTNGRDVVTGAPIQCPTGSGDPQFHRILELLAHIDLSQAPLQNSCDLLTESVSGGQDTICVLVSPYYREDLQECFAQTLQQGCSATWLLPHDKQDPEPLALESDCIFPYEVVL